MDGIGNMVGFILPPAIDLINRKVADTDLRFWISAAFCAVIGVVVNYLTNNMHFVDVNSVLTTIMVIFGEAQLSYHGVYGNSTLRDKIGLVGGSNT